MDPLFRVDGLVDDQRTSKSPALKIGVGLRGAK
jgi:hypothetical protein